MTPEIGRVVIGLSGMGYPLTQVAIRRLGRPGTAVVAAVSVGLLARDAAMIVGGAPHRLRRGPAALLWLEAVTAAIASVLGLRLLVDAGARGRALDPRPSGAEALRRFALGALFGLHTLRFRIYLRPGSGLREQAEPAPSVEVMP
jgi:hypothetical protein